MSSVISQIVQLFFVFSKSAGHFFKRHEHGLSARPEALDVHVSTNESTESITGHVIYNPAYIYKFQLKTTYVVLLLQDPRNSTFLN